MISIIYGRPGSGKTFEAISHYLIPALLDGRPVVTNIDGLDFSAVAVAAHLPYHDVKRLLTINQSQDFWRGAMKLDADDLLGNRLQFPSAAVLIIDEAQVIFPSVDWDKTAREFKTFLQLHRHTGRDIVIITQAAEDLHNGFRRCGGVFYEVRNLGIWFGFQAARIRYRVTARTSVGGLELSNSVHRLGDRIFQCYISGVDPKIFSIPSYVTSFKAALVLIPLFSLLAFSGYRLFRSGGVLGRIFHRSVPKTQISQVATPPPPVFRPRAGATAPARAIPAASSPVVFSEIRNPAQCVHLGGRWSRRVLESLQGGVDDRSVCLAPKTETELRLEARREEARLLSYRVNLTTGTAQNGRSLPLF